MKNTVKTLTLLIICVMSHIGWSAPSLPSLTDRFIFRHLNEIQPLNDDGLRIRDKTGFGAAPSVILIDAATNFFEQSGYHVFDLGLYYIHQYTIGKAQTLIDEKIAELNGQYEKYVLFGYGLGKIGLNHQVYVKWGDDANDIPSEIKAEYTQALGISMIGKSRVGGVESSVIDDTEVWALQLISEFLVRDFEFVSIAEVAGGRDFSASGLTRSSNDGLINTPLGIQTSTQEYFLSPAGVPIKIEKNSRVSFNIREPYRSITFQGCLTKFIDAENRTYSARATKGTADQPPKFAGFRNIINDELYEYLPDVISNESYHKINLGALVKALEVDCSYVLLDEILFKPQLQDLAGGNKEGFALELTSVGEIWDVLQELQGNIPQTMRYCLPSHTAEDIAAADEQVYNPYNMGGVRIKSNKDFVPTFFYIYYDYDAPDEPCYLYWNLDKSAWLKYYPSSEEPKVLDFIVLMKDMGTMFKQMLEDVWVGFETGEYTIHDALDIIGLIPLVGEPADIINGLIYTAEGDHLNAVLSFGAVVPVVGILSTAGKKLGPYTSKVWDATKNIRLTKWHKVCSTGFTGSGLRNSSSGCTWFIKNIDIRPILAKAKASGLGEIAIKKLQLDLYKGSDEFVALMGTSGGVGAWKVCIDHPLIRKDLTSLTSVSKILDNTSISNVISKTELQAVVKNLAQKGVRCRTCTNGNTAYKYLDEVLDDLEYGAVKFGEGYKSVVTGFKQGENFAEGAIFVADAVKRYGNDFPTETIFEFTEVTAGGVRRVDVRVGNTFYEFKSVASVPPSGFADQFVKDLGLADVTQLNQLKWWFDRNKVNSLPRQQFLAELENANIPQNIVDDLTAKFGGNSWDDIIDLIDNNFDEIFHVK